MSIHTPMYLVSLRVGHPRSYAPREALFLLRRLPRPGKGIWPCTKFSTTWNVPPATTNVIPFLMAGSSFLANAAYCYQISVLNVCMNGHFGFPRQCGLDCYLGDNLSLTILLGP